MTCGKGSVTLLKHDIYMDQSPLINKLWLLVDTQGKGQNSDTQTMRKFLGNTFFAFTCPVKHTVYDRYECIKFYIQNFLFHHRMRLEISNIALIWCHLLAIFRLDPFAQLSGQAKAQLLIQQCFHRDLGFGRRKKE